MSKKKLGDRRDRFHLIPTSRLRSTKQKLSLCRCRFQQSLKPLFDMIATVAQGGWPNYIKAIVAIIYGSHCFYWFIFSCFVLHLGLRSSIFTNNCDATLPPTILFVLWIGFIHKLKSDSAGLGFINLLSFLLENLSLFKSYANGLPPISNPPNLSLVQKINLIQPAASVWSKKL